MFVTKQARGKGAALAVLDFLERKSLALGCIAYFSKQRQAYGSTPLLHPQRLQSHSQLWLLSGRRFIHLHGEDSRSSVKTRRPHMTIMDNATMLSYK